MKINVYDGWIIHKIESEYKLEHCIDEEKILTIMEFTPSTCTPYVSRTWVFKTWDNYTVEYNKK